MKEKLIRLLLSVLIAFGLWVYVVTVVSPESEATFHNIQVKSVYGSEEVLQNKGLMLTSAELPTISVRLRGNRADLNGLKNSDITAEVDLSKVNSAGEQALSINVDFKGAFEIVSQDLSSVTVRVAEWTTKEVPIKIDFIGAVGLDYIDYRDERVLDNENITLTGPKEQIDQITQALVTVDLTDRTESITNESYEYVLCDANNNAVDTTGITVNVNEVKLTMKIQRVKEIQLVVNVIYGGGATEENTTVTLSHPTIKVSASNAVLDTLGDKIILGTVKLADIQEDTTLKYSLEEILSKLGVDNISGITELTMDIAFDDLTTKSFNVTKIEVTGLPEGLEFNVDTLQLSFTVRGPKALIDSISLEDIKVTVDLSNAKIGTDRFDALFEMAEGFESVGVIGTHKVTVTLTEAAGGNS